MLQGYGKDTVRPLTIKQILDAQQPYPDSDFKVDGEAISSVGLAGLSDEKALIFWSDHFRWTNQKHHHADHEYHIQGG